MSFMDKIIKKARTGMKFSYAPLHLLDIGTYYLRYILLKVHTLFVASIVAN